jgi:hypothetical protein
VADGATSEILEVLKDIRELLRPVADAHQDAYDQRQAEREAARLEAVRAQMSSDKRRQAWKLADGTRTQREIARAVSMDEGGASRFFKNLRDLGALTDDANPTRAVEVQA